MLTMQTFGTDTARPPVLIVHGLFGSGRNWNVISKRLSDERQVVSVDMRNHGESPRFDTQSYHDMAGDLAEVIDHLGGQADVIGHSMGGKAAMILALEDNTLVNRLVVADIAPVAYGHSQQSMIEAMRAIDLNQVNTRGDADRQLAEMLGDASVRAFLLQSLNVKERQWRLNLDTLETEMVKIVGFPEISATFDGPTLFLAGADSDYVLPEYRARIKALFPAAKQAKIPGVGHWLHAEKPREFEAAARSFLNF
ncbi:alpha/beta fold hydrolase [Aliiroseovarius sp. F20344]|uniref:alpha/beta fold hydrolase n=1 Tax=Aliiroseovarius sp. F20344 TaxID=2926414 RepID=UPI001FF4C358|nr:alpha/beta fold hydrolase [Aliiroseovarius sp. F20344]MCK0142031.1 alpha/beta fold hydrolase [Aliiroseovarius sp. F20344]